MRYSTTAKCFVLLFGIPFLSCDSLSPTSNSKDAQSHRPPHHDARFFAPTAVSENQSAAEDSHGSGTCPTLVDGRHGIYLSSIEVTSTVSLLGNRAEKFYRILIAPKQGPPRFTV